MGNVDAELAPDGIMQLGLGFWGSKTLLSAVELGLFTELAVAGPSGLDNIAQRLGLHARSARDFLDALVALHMLDRSDAGLYTNTAATDHFLDRQKPTYVGGMLEMANTRLYPFWGSLTEALRTGEPQNETKEGRDLFQELYADPERVGGFVKAMTGLHLASARAIAANFPWKEYRTFIDVGAAEGALPVQLALAHPHMTGGGFDLPGVGPHFAAYVARHGVSDRITFHEGDFFADALPAADVVIMGHVLHDWNLEQKLTLIGSAYDALSAGGALIVYENVIDNARRENALGLLMSLNMLIETRGGFDYTATDCMGWMRDCGFRETRTEPLVGPESMVIGVK